MINPHQPPAHHEEALQYMREHRCSYHQALHEVSGDEVAQYSGDGFSYGLEMSGPDLCAEIKPDGSIPKLNINSQEAALAKKFWKWYFRQAGKAPPIRLD